MIFCHSYGASRVSNGEQTSMYAIKLREEMINLDFLSERVIF